MSVNAVEIERVSTLVMFEKKIVIYNKQRILKHLNIKTFHGSK